MLVSSSREVVNCVLKLLSLCIDGSNILFFTSKILEYDIKTK